ncbi:hypothetical protein LCGC14_1612920 [marine sediment metagenome]|uniref:Uncharacterized protein n=1 Tax=marine sediment metagenome TaxID=412755 RepID=A0A0F9I807_9ZZZZ
MEEIVIRSLSHENEKCRKHGYRNWVQGRILARGIMVRPNWEHPQGEAKAAVSKGRWYVKCPGRICDANIPLDEMTQLVFCTACLSIENDHKPFHVDWGDVGILKELLGERRAIQQRNYLPHRGETYKTLKEENKLLVNGIYYGV